MRRLLGGQQGTALVLALAFMVMAVPLVTGALGLGSSLSIDSRVKTDILKDHYSLIGGGDHAIYRLVYETNYANSLIVGVPDTYTVTLNGKTTTITIVKLSDPATSSPLPPVPTEMNRTFQVSKTVAPSTALPYILTTFSYRLDIENRDAAEQKLNQIYDILPPGFTYIVGSTSGITTQNPSMSGQQLSWDVANLNITIVPGQKVSLYFTAAAAVDTGNYCNEAWAVPWGTQTSSGQTAIVRVGSPPNNLCQGAAATLTKTVKPEVILANKLATVTYTITINNSGSVVLNVSHIKDLLPQKFLYTLGSTSGSFTSMNPQTTLQQGRWRLTWDLNPKVQILPEETKTLAFKATANVPAGKYWNETWARIDEFQNQKYTWPTASVTAMGGFEITAKSGESTSTALVLVNPDYSYIVQEWEIVR